MRDLSSRTKVEAAVRVAGLDPEFAAQVIELAALLDQGLGLREEGARLREVVARDAAVERHDLAPLDRIEVAQRRAEWALHELKLTIAANELVSKMRALTPVVMEGLKAAGQAGNLAVGPLVELLDSEADFANSLVSWFNENWPPEQ